MEFTRPSETVEFSRIDTVGGWRASAATFGVRAAALAGIAAAVGAVGIHALNGLFESPDAVATFSWPMGGSTCCIEDSV
ncbi:hypothetical protein [Actinokineospora sp. HUAS TT18]|uniref:hypothetical protein n=1 Tax=Actinokineospora sp. HUAS TT18 TaxID=3447451 RepID=UPI003F51B9C3